MSVYLYDKDTTQIVKRYKTFAAAKAAVTRMHKKYAQTNLYVPGSNCYDNDPLFKYAMADDQYFHMFIEKRRVVRNLMTGADVEVTANTPLCCNPASETYWSM